jgi:two-component system, sensor histidine kinase
MELAIDRQQIAMNRVIEWRFKGVSGRIIQALVVGLLAWIASRSALIPAWFGITLLISLIDAAAFRALLKNTDDPRLRRLALVSLGLAAATFAMIGPLLLGYRSPVSLAGAGLIFCATNLNNALMSRGWSSATYVSVSAASIVGMIGTPLAAYLLGYQFAWHDGLALAGGAVFFIGFIGVTATILERENKELGDALTNLEHQSQATRLANTAAEVAQAANQAKSTFLANISHEIRTPLNGILGMTQVIASNRLSAQQRERVQVVHDSGKALLEILNDVLDLAKIEAGRLDLDVAPFDVDDLAQSARNVFTALAANKGLNIQIRRETEETGIYLGDATRIRQILFNLISNAVKFTQQGAITVTLSQTQGGISVSVQDTGIGMTAETLERLFGRFEQADTSITRHYGGTGLGLAISAELTAIMGGTLRAQSKLGQGSTLILNLPLPRTEALAQATPVAAAAIVDRPMRILAADDNATNRLVLRALLQQAEVEPMIVEDGLQALEAWRTGTWDVILMDIQMPVMDGLTATRLIREEETATQRAATPIIALTANTFDHQVQDYLASGIDFVVPKPIDIGQLFAAIGEAMAPQTSDETEELRQLP